MLPRAMIESTLMARSTSTIVAADVGSTPYTSVSNVPTPASTIPRPPGVNGCGSGSCEWGYAMSAATN